MCDAFRFTSPDGPILIEFDTTNAAVLPIQRLNGEREKKLWGRRRREEGALPLGADVGHMLLDSGAWDGYRPRPVRIAPASFRTGSRRNTWHDLVGCYWILGVLVSIGDEERVYVVTVSTSDVTDGRTGHGSK